jgi:hypothetical protein
MQSPNEMKNSEEYVGVPNAPHRGRADQVQDLPRADDGRIPRLLGLQRTADMRSRMCDARAPPDSITGRAKNTRRCHIHLDCGVVEINEQKGA